MNTTITNTTELKNYYGNNITLEFDTAGLNPTTSTSNDIHTYTTNHPELNNNNLIPLGHDTNGDPIYTTPETLNTLMLTHANLTH